MPEMIALSVAQPYAELIIRGARRTEFRRMSTTKRERVFIFAKVMAGPAVAYRRIGLCPQDLPGGLLLGTVEIVDCTPTTSGFAWHLAGPVRLDPPLRPVRTPLPVWFYPFWPAPATVQACVTGTR